MSDLINIKAQRAAKALIDVAAKHYDLNLKDGLIGMNLVRSAKAYKMDHEHAQSLFEQLWQSTDFRNRDAIAKIIPFIVKAWHAVPENLLHEQLREELARDNRRIGDDWIYRRVNTKASRDLKDRQNLS